ncbi:MAG TPA: alpha/beta hydrolase [Acetobacteraceae bacterium]|nr:alpha/beta hydrolase [Acetobacteraceae bacterium]
MTKVTTLAAVVLLHFCSPIPLLNALAPTNAVSEAHDITYADGTRHRLDVYAPRHSDAAAPVVVFFYGGGWETGDKAMHRFVGTTLAAHGVVVVIPDYRLHPEVQFPAFMQDGAAAVAWAHANAAHFGGDPRRLFLMGHSAGAQIATLLALDTHYLLDAGLASGREVCGVVALAGLYDFLPQASDAVKAVFGPADAWPRAQPVNYASPVAPPMLLLAGDADRSVDPGNTLRLAARLQAAGASVRSGLEPGISHRAIVVALADSLSFLAPVRAQTLDFIAAQGSCREQVSEASAARSRSAPATPE